MKGESHPSAIAAALACSPSRRIKWEVALVRLLAPTPLIRLRLEGPEWRDVGLMCAVAHFGLARLCYHKDDRSSRRYTSPYKRIGGRILEDP